MAQELISFLGASYRAGTTPERRDHDAVSDVSFTSLEYDHPPYDAQHLRQSQQCLCYNLYYRNGSPRIHCAIFFRIHTSPYWVSRGDFC
jgi:hypothetical protein